MARIPEQEIERLKVEVSVERLVEGSGIELKRSGKDYVGRCPFHEDDTASLVVSPAKNLWHYFGCGVAGGPPPNGHAKQAAAWDRWAALQHLQSESEPEQLSVLLAIGRGRSALWLADRRDSDRAVWKLIGSDQMLNYASGESVKLGDRVSLGNDSDGVVVCVLDTGEYSSAYPEAQWGYLKKGVLINFPVHGLIHYEVMVEPDVKFIVRGAVSSV